MKKTLLAPLLWLTLPASLPQAQEGPRIQDPKLERRRTAIVEVVEAVRPAVVSIDCSIPQRDWFGRIVEASVAGTGVLIYEDGYIVTNNHVVASGGRIADDIKVRFDEADDGTIYAGIVISTVPEEDLALIKIDSDRSFPTVPFTDADPMLGEQVIAIGNAWRQTHTVSTGIISGLHRDLDIPNHEPPLHFKGLIQTDAAINHGNSGGPLLDINGELIGINTAITGGAENIGFAIPASRVKWVLTQHLLSLKKARSYLGCEIDERDFAIVEVVPGSPADDAGLRVGDRLSAIDGKAFEDLKAYRLLRLSILPRKEVDLTVRRGAGRRDVSLTAWSPYEGVIHERLGVKVESVAFGRRYRRLLQITDVDPEGPAARIGLQDGDYIDAVRPEGRRPQQVSRRQDLALLIAALEVGTSMEVEVWRDDDADGRLERDNRYSELYTGKLRLR